MTTFLLSLILMSIWIGFYQLVKQQGRILMRLDNVERNLFSLGNNVPHAEDAVVEELPFGTEFPDFELTDLSGTTRKLSDFRGQRLLLIHWNFDCGFCDAIAGDLARLEPDLETRNARVVLLALGDNAFNRSQATRHGLNSLILLLSEKEEEKKVPKPFEHQGTPVAYLVDEYLQVAAPFASGADQVLALARTIATSVPDSSEGKLARARLKTERSLAESRIERNGLPVGTPAPKFQLPDLHGRLVSMDDYRSQRVLLVFSDPHCGPCDELAPHLARFHRRYRSNGLSLIMIGRGEIDENREKAEKFGFEFPVVLQDKWKLSKEYGIFATPVAFLIAENGLIAQDVAVGKDAILALAADAAKKAEWNELTIR